SGSPSATRFTSPDASDSNDVTAAAASGAISTMSFRSRSRRVSVKIDPWSCRSSIGFVPADMNTSTGAPAATCCDSAPDAPKLKSTCAPANFAPISSIAGCKLAATETVRFADRGREHPAASARTARAVRLRIAAIVACLYNGRAMFPYDPQLRAIAAAAPHSIPDVLGTMRAIDALVADGDGLKWFNWLYLQVTEAVEQRVGASNGFRDPAWLARLDVEFASLYFSALAAWLAGRPAPGCWTILFQNRTNAPIARIQFAL